MIEVRKYFLLFIPISLGLLVFAVFPFLDNRLHLVFCDVGQGDGILVYYKHTQILVDAGPDSSILNCLSGHMPFWDRKIEMAVITNADLDHYGGFIDVVRRYKVDAFATSDVGKGDLAYETLEKEVRIAKIKTIKLDTGDKLKIGNLVLLTLWPDKNWIAQNALAEPANKQGLSNAQETVLGTKTAKASLNEFSLVLDLSYGQFDALLTGDVVPPATDLVIGNSDSRWEVLKVPHHGSKNGLTQEMLEKVSPELAVISVGKNNRYGHPHEEVMGILSEMGVETLRTDTQGEVEVVTDGKTWEVER